MLLRDTSLSADGIQLVVESGIDDRRCHYTESVGLILISTAHRCDGHIVPRHKLAGSKRQRELAPEDLEAAVQSKGSIAQTRRRLREGLLPRATTNPELLTPRSSQNPSPVKEVTHVGPQLALRRAPRRLAP